MPSRSGTPSASRPSKQQRATLTKVAVGLHDWPGDGNADRLAFVTGDRIKVITQGEPDGWWLGSLPDGRRGWFPSSFCRIEDANNNSKTAKAAADAVSSSIGSSSRISVGPGGLLVNEFASALTSLFQSTFGISMEETEAQELVNSAELANDSGPGLYTPLAPFAKVTARKPEKLQRLDEREEAQPKKKKKKAQEAPPSAASTPLPSKSSRAASPRQVSAATPAPAPAVAASAGRSKLPSRAPSAKPSRASSPRPATPPRPSTPTRATKPTTSKPSSKAAPRSSSPAPTKPPSTTNSTTKATPKTAKPAPATATVGIATKPGKKKSGAAVSESSTLASSSVTPADSLRAAPDAAARPSTSDDPASTTAQPSPIPALLRPRPPLSPPSSVPASRASSTRAIRTPPTESQRLGEASAGRYDASSRRGVAKSYANRINRLIGAERSLLSLLFDSDPVNIWVSIDAAHDHSTISAMQLPRSIAILAMRKPAIQSKALENPGSAQKVAQGDELLLRGSPHNLATVAKLATGGGGSATPPPASVGSEGRGGGDGMGSGAGGGVGGAGGASAAAVLMPKRERELMGAAMRREKALLNGTAERLQRSLVPHGRRRIAQAQADKRAAWAAGRLQGWWRGVLARREIYPVRRAKKASAMKSLLRARRLTTGLVKWHHELPWREQVGGLGRAARMEDAAAAPAREWRTRAELLISRIYRKQAANARAYTNELNAHFTSLSGASHAAAATHKSAASGTSQARFCEPLSALALLFAPPIEVSAAVAKESAVVGMLVGDLDLPKGVTLYAGKTHSQPALAAATLQASDVVTLRGPPHTLALLTDPPSPGPNGQAASATPTGSIKKPALLKPFTLLAPTERPTVEERKRRRLQRLSLLASAERLARWLQRLVRDRFARRAAAQRTHAALLVQIAWWALVAHRGNQAPQNNVVADQTEAEPMSLAWHHHAGGASLGGFGRAAMTKSLAQLAQSQLQPPSMHTKPTGAESSLSTPLDTPGSRASTATASSTQDAPSAKGLGRPQARRKMPPQAANSKPMLANGSSPSQDGVKRAGVGPKAKRALHMPSKSSGLPDITEEDDAARSGLSNEVANLFAEAFPRRNKQGCPRAASPRRGASPKRVASPRRNASPRAASLVRSIDRKIL